MSTKELPKEIQEVVKQHAEVYCTCGNECPTKEDYIAGATAWAKITIGLGEYIRKEHWRGSAQEGFYWRKEISGVVRKTTEEILLEYIKTLP